ncbi:hypothetical protein KGM_202776 [Danaus plexippus plexippus]|uniref:Uncharacterized protein n=1 Tax=Danaus plexippus plexippus TaxID=278856 RepID=A0A212EX08_DANPL|nr:hypothetical protein KGM_202776 [Danaus plexippus plexippus]
MNETTNSNFPEPRRIGVWTEGAPVETREFVMPKKSAESIDDIPTIPDLDDLQDILEKEISKPPMSEHQDAETMNTLAEVRGVSGSVDGIEAAIEVLKSYIPEVEPDIADTVWTVDTLLAQLAEELLIQ